MKKHWVQILSLALNVMLVVLLCVQNQRIDDLERLTSLQLNDLETRLSREIDAARSNFYWELAGKAETQSPFHITEWNVDVACNKDGKGNFYLAYPSVRLERGAGEVDLGIAEFQLRKNGETVLTAACQRDSDTLLGKGFEGQGVPCAEGDRFALYVLCGERPQYEVFLSEWEIQPGIQALEQRPVSVTPVALWMQ